MKKKNRPQKIKRAVIKEEFVALLGCHIEALILNQFLYWSERTGDVDQFIAEEKKRNPELEIEPTYGWIYKSSEELSDELMIGVSPSTMRRYLAKVVEKGYLEQRNNPKHKWDRCLQYRPDILKIQSDLQEIGYALEEYPLLITENPFFKMKNASCKMKNRASNSENRTPQNEKAIPETTTEITTENSSPPKIDYLNDIVTHEPDHEQESIPSDFEKYFGGFRDEILSIYQDTFGRHPNPGHKDALVELSRQSFFEPGAFKKFLEAYNRNGGYPYDISRIEKEYRQYLKVPINGNGTTVS
jgi:hypothetical protein